MKVPITLLRLENPYNVPPPIAITGNRLTLFLVGNANAGSFVSYSFYHVEVLQVV